MALGADKAVALSVVGEGLPAKLAACLRRAVKDRNVGREPAIVQPGQERSRPIALVGGQALQREPEGSEAALQHGPGADDLLAEPGRRGLHIHNDGMAVVDEVVGLVAEATGAVLYGLCSLGICQGDSLGRLVRRPLVRLGGFGLELMKVGLHRACHRARVGPGFRSLVRRRPPVPAGIGFDVAATDQGHFTPNETRFHAPTDHHLERRPQHVIIGEASMPVFEKLDRSATRLFSPRRRNQR